MLRSCWECAEAALLDKNNEALRRSAPAATIVSSTPKHVDALILVWIVRSLPVGLHLFPFRMRRRPSTIGIGDVQHAECTRVNAPYATWNDTTSDIRLAHGLELS